MGKMRANLVGATRFETTLDMRGERIAGELRPAASERLHHLVVGDGVARIVVGLFVDHGHLLPVAGRAGQRRVDCADPGARGADANSFVDPLNIVG